MKWKRGVYLDMWKDYGVSMFYRIKVEILYSLEFGRYKVLSELRGIMVSI